MDNAIISGSVADCDLELVSPCLAPSANSFRSGGANNCENEVNKLLPVQKRWTTKESNKFDQKIWKKYELHIDSSSK